MRLHHYQVSVCLICHFYGNRFPCPASCDTALAEKKPSLETNDKAVWNARFQFQIKKYRSCQRKARDRGRWVSGQVNLLPQATPSKHSSATFEQHQAVSTTGFWVTWPYLRWPLYSQAILLNSLMREEKYIKISVLRTRTRGMTSWS